MSLDRWVLATGRTIRKKIYGGRSMKSNGSKSLKLTTMCAVIASLMTITGESLRSVRNRSKNGVDHPRLEDRVADNLAKFEITESEDLLFGKDFGIGTDIHTGPNGNLFVVSLSNGAVYEIYRTK
jgi:hypothetical protein